jgi:hypothetical protein
MPDASRADRLTVASVRASVLPLPPPRSSTRGRDRELLFARHEPERTDESRRAFLADLLARVVDAAGGVGSFAVDL